MEILLKEAKGDDKKDKDYVPIIDSTNNIGRILGELASDKYFSINSIHLYFELEDEKSWNEDDIGNLYVFISEALYKDKELKLLFQEYIECCDNDAIKADQVWAQVDKILQDYIKLFENFIQLLEKIQQTNQSNIRKIKEQLRIKK